MKYHKTQTEITSHLRMTEENHKMEYEIKQPIKVQDGAHKGVIVDIEYRTEPYKYTDIIIEFQNNNEPMRMKYGCPSFVTKESKLGKLLTSFGAELKVGEKIEDNKILVGKECCFMTLTTDRDGKKYSNIVQDSLKPVVKEEVVNDA